MLAFYFAAALVLVAHLLAIFSLENYFFVSSLTTICQLHTRKSYVYWAVHHCDS